MNRKSVTRGRGRAECSGGGHRKGEKKADHLKIMGLVERCTIQAGEGPQGIQIE
jgi:hypothetical protein